ncbi:DNA-binding MarR family transcriptional regulator [Paenibacillus rhizosphaerae]|uniref:DNA-binding MarR family transcriptional regulator n=1 Tax=Paenibacillus rhizosphaerae TaxID=297318 RepID=A0A839U2H2_9BACL|nr:MarR family winged helix-turn-helix transcriptional regulator [Paenibacillus rhizosphaerae]MBB3131858.1 DNA-binding MarR family transcriptional regulator [Paenibacillus rhizosphaerae]
MPNKEPIGKLISYIHRQNQKRLAKELAPYGIGGGGQHSFLKVILYQPGITQEQLTQQLKFDKATTARSIKQLEASGYIERKPDPDDRRSQLLYPTSKAKQMRPQLHAILDDSNRILTKYLTPEEQDQLISLLHKVSLAQKDE